MNLPKNKFKGFDIESDTRNHAPFNLCTKVKSYIINNKEYLNHVKDVYIKETMAIPKVFFILDESKIFDENFWGREMTTFENFGGWDIDVTIGTKELWEEDSRTFWTKLV
ncbi:hypothetical protein HK099_004935 [Clydaea vesicula]|uniref:Uncharacterized protein n=1 Tax=Clydaea vesicula TaxID=447962 RepID=A0AAD5TZX9_9FUNG|nr:hypothetical protein HK099_004935 [Clydaea vesicula]